MSWGNLRDLREFLGQFKGIYRQTPKLHLRWGGFMRIGFAFLHGFLHGLSGTSVWRPQSRYTVSRIECRINFPQNQRCRAKIALHPPKSRCRTFLRTPLSHFPLIRSRAGGSAGWWRVSRHFWVPKTDRATGGCRSYSPHQSRYSVQLSSWLGSLFARTLIERPARKPRHASALSTQAVPALYCI